MPCQGKSKPTVGEVDQPKKSRYWHFKQRLTRRGDTKGCSAFLSINVPSPIRRESIVAYYDDHLLAFMSLHSWITVILATTVHRNRAGQNCFFTHFYSLKQKGLPALAYPTLSLLRKISLLAPLSLKSLMSHCISQRHSMVFCDTYSQFRPSGDLFSMLLVRPLIRSCCKIVRSHACEFTKRGYAAK